MSEPKFEYAFPFSATDTPGQVNRRRLSDEIQAVPSVIPAFFDVRKRAGQHWVVFSYVDELDSAQEIALNDVVVTHDGTPDPPVALPKAFRYIGSNHYDDYMLVDYKRGYSVRLHPKLIYSDTVRGEVKRIELYANAELQVDGSITFDDLIIDEVVTYIRTPGYVALAQSKEHRWYDEDGNVVYSKIRTKLYNDAERLEEGKRRRKNHVSLIQIEALRLLQLHGGLAGTPIEIAAQAQLLGGTFIASIQSLLELYKEAGDKGAELILAVLNDPQTATDHSWLNSDVGDGSTILDYFITEMTIPS